MKKTFFLLLALMAAFASCDKVETDNGNENENTAKKDSTFYYGTLIANASSGDCETPDTKVSINITDKADSVSITIFRAKLAQRMPAMDIIIPNISVRKNEETTVITSERAIPLAMGNEFPSYTVTEFTGEIKDNELTFSLKFGTTPTSFSGRR